MKKSLMLWGLAMLILVASVLYFFPTSTQAGDEEGDQNPPDPAAPLPLTGYAWSSNIGWLSFRGGGSGGSYGVDLIQDQTTPQMDGYLRGYAWSSNIGWVRFDPSIFPGTRNNPWGALIEADGDVTGWARACVVYVSGCSGTVKTIDGTELGGWDGWIKMSGLTSPGGEPYGVRLDGNNLRGFAWGDDVVGWLNFDLTGNAGPGDCSESVCIGGGGGNLSAQCDVRVVGRTATWTGSYQNNSGAATCSWSGDMGGVGGAGCTRTYTNDTGDPVTKTLTVTVTDSSGSATDTCDATLIPGTGPRQCSDGQNNDPEEDELVDQFDPGCHTDGIVHADPLVSYDPNDDREANGGPALDPLPGSAGIRITAQSLAGEAVALTPVPDRHAAFIKNNGTVGVQIGLKHIKSQRPGNRDLLVINTDYPNTPGGILNGTGNQLLPKCWFGPVVTDVAGYTVPTTQDVTTDCTALETVTLDPGQIVGFALEIYRPLRRILDNSPYIVTIGDVTDTDPNGNDLDRNVKISFIFGVGNVIDE